MIPIPTSSDPRDTPRYAVAEAARYIPGLSPATLRSWVKGRTYPRKHDQGTFQPLIQLPIPEAGRLSFNNLVEAHILYGLRTYHAITVPHLRTALHYAEAEFGLDRLLLRTELLASPGNLFVERYDQLVNLGKGGQLGMRRILSAYLKRVHHDSAGWARRLFPLLPSDSGRKDVAIDPEIAFGKPILLRCGVRVATLADRFDGGEPLARLAEDYGIEEEEVEEAITYARAA